MQKAQRTNARAKSKHFAPAKSGDAIKVSAKDGQSYADILKEMMTKVIRRQDSRSCLPEGPEEKKSFWSSKREETLGSSGRNFTRRLGRGRKFQPQRR